MRQPITFDFGGSRTVRVTLGLAPKLERATGLGVMVLAEQARRFTLPLHHAVEIVRLAVLESGARMTPAKAMEAAERIGIVETITLAAIIINELFLPADVKGKKGSKPAADDGEDADPLAVSH